NVAQLVAVQAATAPEAIAVTHGPLSLTYKELNQRADQLAHSLMAMGVGPDVIVGIYLNRSLAMIVAALAVLKAGGAYLPLDPNYPAERLAFMLQDSQAPVLVTGQCMLNALPMPPQYVVALDAQGRYAEGEIAEPIISRATASDLAYVIYTSGSTGQPKGVEVTHGGLLNLVAWHQRAFKVTATDKASQLSALGFDAAVWELWPYLTAGASIHLPDRVITDQPETVRDWLVSQGITITFLPTPLAERLMTLEWPAKISLRTMLTGADTLHHYPPRKLRFQLVNNYGPTECTVVATSGTVPPTEHPDRLPTIGRPIDNVQIHILNENMQAVPMGEAGEVYIGGAGVARGYRHRPDLTAERFVGNPFNSDPNARLYKTGDLARYLADGQIAFLGRIDEQIKIRGFRIEPAEIVKILDEHPAVQASIVVAREIAPGDKRLVAYFVPAPKAQPTHTEMRNFLAGRLPEYLVPATFVKLETLPLNSSGKVDRSALPAPATENTLRDNLFVGPRNPIEERLAAMLAPLLGLDKVSMEDNFFLLGGHSLLGTQLIARVRDAFGIELSLRSLFDAPTVSGLAVQIEALLVAKLEAMSEAEAQRLLDASTPACA
ncbi:MAG TPA: non-ribosomal peptide synthetase, partial [Terriglobales bacterium]|nr:non-ribosomal peptide synthetase [Terriglobales bacterium]